MAEGVKDDELRVQKDFLDHRALVMYNSIRHRTDEDAEAFEGKINDLLVEKEQLEEDSHHDRVRFELELQEKSGLIEALTQQVADLQQSQQSPLAPARETILYLLSKHQDEIREIHNRHANDLMSLRRDLGARSQDMMRAQDEERDRVFEDFILIMRVV